MQVACLSRLIPRKSTSRGLYLEYPSWANTTHMFPPRFPEHQYQLVFYHGGVYLAVLSGSFIFCRREGSKFFWGFPFLGGRQAWRPLCIGDYGDAPLISSSGSRNLPQKCQQPPPSSPPPVSCGWWGGSKQAASWRSLVFPPVGPKSPPPECPKN